MLALVQPLLAGPSNRELCKEIWLFLWPGHPQSGESKVKQCPVKARSSSTVQWSGTLELCWPGGWLLALMTVGGGGVTFQPTMMVLMWPYHRSSYKGHVSGIFSSTPLQADTARYCEKLKQHPQPRHRQGHAVFLSFCPLKKACTLEPHWKQPWEFLRTNFTAVQYEGEDSSTHASWTKPALPFCLEVYDLKKGLRILQKQPSFKSIQLPARASNLTAVRH